MKDRMTFIFRGRPHRSIKATFPERDSLFTIMSPLFLNIVQIYSNIQLICKDSKSVCFIKSYIDAVFIICYYIRNNE